VAGRLRAVAAPAALVVALAGCGGGSSSNGIASRSADEILASTRSAALAASAVHVKGSLKESGKPLKIDLKLVSPDKATGSLAEGSESFQLIRVGTNIYIKGSKAFYRSIGGPSAAQLLGGRWLKGPSSGSDFQSIAAFTSMKTLLSQALKPEGKVAKTGTKTVDGREAVGLKDPAQGGTLYVATSGKAYPVEIVSGSGENISFSEWDQSVSITAPKNAVDISKLKGG
jgi:hypothetical protein